MAHRAASCANATPWPPGCTVRPPAWPASPWPARSVDSSMTPRAAMVEETWVDPERDPERWTKVHHEIDRLPQKYRQAIVLCYLERPEHRGCRQSAGLPPGHDPSAPARASPARPPAAPKYGVIAVGSPAQCRLPPRPGQRPPRAPQARGPRRGRCRHAQFWPCQDGLDPGRNANPGGDPSHDLHETEGGRGCGRGHRGGGDGPARSGLWAGGHPAGERVQAGPIGSS